MTNKQITGIVGLVLFMAVAGAYIFMSNAGQPVAQTEQPAAQEEEQIAVEGNEDAQPAARRAANTEADESPSAVTAATEPAAGDVNIDIGAAMTKRTLGDPDAPVKIEEYASLSCGHCAHFYKDTFPQLKETYIDTGKVFFTYNDMPLNAPAMDAAMLARCLPHDKYFKFIKFLYETQEQWAFTGDYRNKLTQAGKLVGASDAVVEACLGSEQLKQQMASAMQEAAQKHKIEATPTFVINGTTERGAHNFESFQKIIDPMLKESADNQ